MPDQRCGVTGVALSAIGEARTPREGEELFGVRCIRYVLNAPVEVMIDQVRSHQLMTALPVLAACAPSAVAERSPIPTLQLTVTRLSGTTRPFPQIDQHRVAASHGSLYRGIVDPLYGEHRLSNTALVFATMGAAHT